MTVLRRIVVDDVITLHVTGHDGRTRNATVDSKHLLVYESAKVMTSMSLVAHDVTMCHVFFKPSVQWRWSQHDDVISDGERSESVFGREELIPHGDEGRDDVGDDTHEGHSHDEL